MITQETIDTLLLPENIASTRLLLKHHLKKFIKVFHFHTTKQQFVFKPFHNKIIKELQSVVFGTAEKQHLAISIVPRTGKSLLVRYFLAWGYAFNKDCNNIYTSFNSDLVLGFSDRIKVVIESDAFKVLFRLSISKSEDSKKKWSVQGGGGFYAPSQAGAVTGMGAGSLEGKYFGGCLVVDDPTKPQEAKSPVFRKKTIEYFEETLQPRINNPEKTPIIVIMQRLHQEDLIGYLMENYSEDFKFISFPAYDEETDTLLWEEKYSKAKLFKIRDRSPFYFYSQMQQNPIVHGGSTIKLKWLRFYDELPSCGEVYQSWDTAIKDGDKHDYSVCGTILVVTTKFCKQFYLIDLFRGKLIYPELKAKQEELQLKFNPKKVVIEDKASGQQLIQEAKAKGNNKVVGYKPLKGKEFRAEEKNGLVDELYSGNVFFDKSANYYPDLKAELVSFPNGAHDDCVDMLSQIVNYINKPKAGLFIGGVKID